MRVEYPDKIVRMSPISAPRAREPPQAERTQEAMAGAVLSCSGREVVTSSTRADTAAVVTVDTAGIMISAVGVESLSTFGLHRHSSSSMQHGITFK